LGKGVVLIGVVSLKKIKHPRISPEMLWVPGMG
jgi:hypothetical protein